MEFEYIPKLAIAYDANHNLVHVTDARDAEKYVCPCCGDIVKKVGNRTFLHINEDCDLNKQLEFYCENWLLPSVKANFKPIITTPYGNYVPDVEIVTPEGKTVYVELFFHMRKLDSNYYCKWEYLGNDVIEVDYYTNHSRYIYQNGSLFDKEYAEKDFYYNNVSKLDAKEFWQAVCKGSLNAIAESMMSMSHAKRVACYEILGKMPAMQDVRKNIKTIFNSAAIIEAIQINERGNAQLCIDEIKPRLYKCYMQDKSLFVQGEHPIYYRSATSLIDKGNFLDFLNKQTEHFNSESEVIVNKRNKMQTFAHDLHKIEDLGYKTCIYGDYIAVFEFGNRILVDYKHDYSCEKVLNELKLANLTKKLSEYYKNTGISVSDRKIVITIKGIVRTVCFDVDSDFEKVTEMVEKTIEKCQQEYIEPLEKMVQEIRGCANHVWNASSWNNKLSVWFKFAPDNLRIVTLNSGVDKFRADVTMAMNDILNTIEDYGWRIEVC